MSLMRLTLTLAAVGLTARWLSKVARTAAHSVEPDGPLFEGDASELGTRTAPDLRNGSADPAGARTVTLADGDDEVRPGMPDLSRQS
ncbi:hypothetical protein [Rhizobacter sp. LjRoot28]|uniref:hypothetical protein n=1 Tax=Rhizobacter sp. LjRoot28 TaxID=3342309 RepID=UPI003ED0C862